MQETAELARYAATCRYDDIPPDVVERAKQCITDTVAAVVFGYDLPWSRMIVAFAEKNGAGGNSRILGDGAGRVHAPADRSRPARTHPRSWLAPYRAVQT